MKVLALRFMRAVLNAVYAVMKAVARKWESLSIPTVVLALIFLLKLFVE